MMSKATVAGILIWIVGGVVVLFKGISYFMGRQFPYNTVEQICGLAWIDQVPFEVFRNALTFVSTSQLPVVLFFTGLVVIIIGMFKKF
jgi:hypothetical protein